MKKDTSTLLCSIFYFYVRWFPGGSDCNKSSYSAGDPGSIPGLGRSLGEGNGNPLQYSFLENSMGRDSLLSQDVSKSKNS